MCDMTHSYVWHDSGICVMSWIRVTWLIHRCDVTHSYLLHDSFCAGRDSFHICYMTNSYLLHDSFYVGRDSFHMCDMTHSYLLHDSFYVGRDSKSVPRRQWVMSSHVPHKTSHIKRVMSQRDSFTYGYRQNSHVVATVVAAQCWGWCWSYVCHDSCICVTRLIHTCDMNHAYVWHDSCLCMTWLIQMCAMTHLYREIVDISDLQ